MNGTHLISYLVAVEDFERRNQTQRALQQRAAVAGNRGASGAIGFTLARLGGWLRNTSSFAEKRDTVNCPAMAC